MRCGDYNAKLLRDLVYLRAWRQDIDAKTLRPDSVASTTRCQRRDSSPGLTSAGANDVERYMTPQEHCQTIEGNPSPGEAENLSPIELEAKLVAQEHRTVQIIWNFLGRRRHWKDGDPRRAAAVRALVWKFFSPGTMAIAGGSLVGLASVVLLTAQTFLLSRQIQEQQAQFDLERRTTLLTYLYEAVPQRPTNDPDATTLSPPSTDVTSSARPNEARPEPQARWPAKVRANALREFLGLERNRIERERIPGKTTKFAFVDLTGALLQDVELPKIDLSNVTLSYAYLNRANFKSASFQNANMYHVDAVGTVWSDANLTNCRIYWSMVRGADFSGGILDKAQIVFSDLQRAKMDGVSVLASEFSYSDLSYALIMSIPAVEIAMLLSGASEVEFPDDTSVGRWARVSSLTGTIIKETLALEEWKSWAIERGAVESGDGNEHRSVGEK